MYEASVQSDLPGRPAWTFWEGPRPPMIYIPWVCGNSFRYCKWRTSHPDPKGNEEADMRPMWSPHLGELVAHRDRDFLVTIIHDRNPSLNRKTHAAEYSDLSIDRIHGLMRADASFCEIGSLGRRFWRQVFEPGDLGGFVAHELPRPPPHGLPAFGR